MAYTEADRLADNMQRARRKLREASGSLKDCRARIVKSTEELAKDQKYEPELVKSFDQARKEFDAMMNVYANSPWFDIQGKPKDPPKLVVQEALAI